MQVSLMFLKRIKNTEHLLYSGLLGRVRRGRLGR